MIARISGIVAEVDEASILLERDGLGYEVLVPTYAISELAALRGQQAVLHTLEYLEGSAAGSNLIPRLVGFCRIEDRAFFSQFITVKGLGVRKGLRALAEPVAVIASAIENGDATRLCGLPGVGKRTAEQIIASLRGKLDAFVLASADAVPEHTWTQEQRDALSVLVALGERHSDARSWLERAMRLNAGPCSADEWMKAAYRIKTGVEG